MRTQISKYSGDGFKRSSWSDISIGTLRLVATRNILRRRWQASDSPEAANKSKLIKLIALIIERIIINNAATIGDSRIEVSIVTYFSSSHSSYTGLILNRTLLAKGESTIYKSKACRTLRTAFIGYLLKKIVTTKTSCFLGRV